MIINYYFVRYNIVTARSRKWGEWSKALALDVHVPYTVVVLHFFSGQTLFGIQSGQLFEWNVNTSRNPIVIIVITDTFCDPWARSIRIQDSSRVIRFAAECGSVTAFCLERLLNRAHNFSRGL